MIVAYLFQLCLFHLRVCIYACCWFFNATNDCSYKSMFSLLCRPVLGPHRCAGYFSDVGCWRINVVMQDLFPYSHQEWASRNVNRGHSTACPTSRLCSCKTSCKTKKYIFAWEALNLVVWLVKSLEWAWSIKKIWTVALSINTEIK